MKEQDAAHSFEKKTPSWYTADEMYHWLIREKYSEVIAKELCQKWSEDLQGAFNKGYEKSVKELTRLRSELQILQSALDHCKEVGSIRQDLIAEQKSELQQEREKVQFLLDELIYESRSEPGTYFMWGRSGGSRVPEKIMEIQKSKAK